MKLVIVGGVAGGASAAARARRLDEHAEIVVLERGPDVSFANCGLPYFVGGEIADRGKLLVTTAGRLRERFALDVRPLSEAVAIDRAARTVTVREVATGREYTETYDKLILSPGAAPVRPDIPGIDSPNVFTLRTLADADHIKAALDGGVKSVALLGGGFIGLELAEALTGRGVAVTLIERNPQVLTPLDFEMATPVAARLRERGVRLLLNSEAAGITPAAGGLRVTLKSGDTVDVGVVVAGVGVRPDSGLAVAAGLAVNDRGGIVVNEYMQTTDQDIYAVGDAVGVTDVVTGAAGQVPLGGPANRQGRLAADHAFGRPARYRGTQGTAVVGCFGLTAALTGASQKTLRRLKVPHRAVTVHPQNHAGYYPGAEPMTLKLVVAPDTGKVLGAQAVGGAGVDKRIDVIAVAIQAGMTAFDLEEMELCYAPQFGSAKDPVNMAGFVAAGLVRGDHPQVTADELPAGAFVLDVRTPTEFAGGHLPGAVNIPVDELRGRLGELPAGRPIVAYCQVGMRGYLATRILLQRGHDAVNLAGGWKAWELFHPPAI